MTPAHNEFCLAIGFPKEKRRCPKLSLYSVKRERVKCEKQGQRNEAREKQ